MPKIEIYSGPHCPYCVRAKGLLDRKRAEYTEYDISKNEETFVKMLQRTGGRKSIPQIFIDDQLIGGCDDLHALDRDGKLDLLLGKEK